MENLKSGHGALQIWDKAAILSSPLELKAWLLVMACSFLGGLFFIKKNLGAKMVIICVFSGLGFTKLIAPLIEITVFSGLVALTHVLLWPAALVFLFKDAISGRGIYKYWSIWVSGVMLASLVFDVRDAYIYLRYIFGI